jgi:hypothetical protein
MLVPSRLKLYRSGSQPDHRPSAEVLHLLDVRRFVSDDEVPSTISNCP